MGLSPSFASLSCCLFQESGALWSCKLVENEVTRSKTLPLDPIKYGSNSTVKYVQMVAFVDRVFPTFISKFAQGGWVSSFSSTSKLSLSTLWIVLFCDWTGVGCLKSLWVKVLCYCVWFRIIAMYIALVLLIWQKVRGVLTSQPLDVMISEIPNPDHLLKICQDIYLVREAKDFVLEQVLVF